MSCDRRIGVLIVIENLPFPFVRRAWQEACALRDAGYRVSVISPKGAGCEQSFETIEGISRSTVIGFGRHPGRRATCWNTAARLPHSSYLALKIYFRTRFRVVHTWNPPDIMFLIGLFFKLFGARYIFDHLDLNPELYLAKFGREDFLYRLICFVERATFWTADVSLATNQSYREIAIQRGGMPPERVFIVRVSPEPEKMRRGPAYPELKHGKETPGLVSRRDGAARWARPLG